MYIYYPSCNFQKQFPKTAGVIRAYMLTQPDVKIAGCCHKTSDMPVAGDVIVTICMSCMRRLDEIRADIPVINLSEFLLTREDFPWPDHRGESITLQDCFRARGKHALQDAVRGCLTKMKYEVIEMPENRDEESFDGPFLLHEPNEENRTTAPRYFAEFLPQHITPLPEKEWKIYFNKQAEKYTTKKVVCYCNTCVKGTREGGADAAHLCELVFGN